MGSCLSKKTTSSTPNPLPDPPLQFKPNLETEKKKNPTPTTTTTTEQQQVLKKEIFIIKHRKSHEIDREQQQQPPSLEKKTLTEISHPSNITASPAVRTSSCTKEEVDAILIQCGRLSRSSSTEKIGSNGRKYSGSKRSCDFDNEIGYKERDNNDEEIVVVEDGEEGERIRNHRNRQREPRVSSPSSSRRRRTPSREREREGSQQNQHQRSGSKERGSGNGGGRRVSRSPGRRSESPSANSALGNASSGGRPGKMVSVPATVNSGGGGGEVVVGGGVKRIQVKRNVGEVGARNAASPRSRSPAGGNVVRVLNENQNVNSNQEHQKQQQPLSLSRSNSRKAEQSPYRRNPLGDIDNNVAGFEQFNKAPLQNPNGEKMSNNKVAGQGIDNKSTHRGTLENNFTKPVDESKGELQPMTSNVAVTVVVPTGSENLKLQTLTRTRSSRRFGDLDIDKPENLLNPNPNPSYTALLLKDIQNFHQKNTIQQPAFSLPACVTKACSILEAVADLNSTTSSNLSLGFSEERRKTPTNDQVINKNDTKDPFVESEMSVNDDLMEPSLHKYVTVRRGAEMEEQESSGSNSLAGSQQLNWPSSSSWEPNSADSTDCWTSSRRENDLSPCGFQQNAVSEMGREKKRELDYHRNGIGRGRLGSSISMYAMPNNATVGST